MFRKGIHAVDFTPEEISLFDHFRLLRIDSLYMGPHGVPQDAIDCVIFVKKFVKKAELNLAK